jgi:hypothetical protein
MCTAESHSISHTLHFSSDTPLNRIRAAKRAGTAGAHHQPRNEEPQVRAVCVCACCVSVCVCVHVCVSEIERGYTRVCVEYSHTIFTHTHTHTHTRTYTLTHIHSHAHQGRALPGKARKREAPQDQSHCRAPGAPAGGVFWSSQRGAVGLCAYLYAYVCGRLSTWRGGFACISTHMYVHIDT